MVTTLDLLSKALEKQKAARWCSDLNMPRSTLSQAKRRGRLSPTIAGNLAMKLGENPIYWAGIAAYEAEPESPLKHALADYIESQQSKVSLQNHGFRRAVLSELIGRALWRECRTL